MSMTIRLEPVVPTPGKDPFRWMKKHPKKTRKLAREYDRTMGRPINRSTPLSRSLSGQERVKAIHDKMDDEFRKAFPQVHGRVMVEYLGLRFSSVETGSKVHLGYQPIFKRTEKPEEEYSLDLVNAKTVKNEPKISTYAGSLTPIREYPRMTSKYKPHQGQRECARRRASL
jgi:hypothetical protein